MQTEWQQLSFHFKQMEHSFTRCKGKQKQLPALVLSSVSEEIILQLMIDRQTQFALFY